MDILDWLVHISKDAAPVIPGGQFEKWLLDQLYPSSAPPGYASQNPSAGRAPKATQNPPGWEDQIPDGASSNTSNDPMPGVAPQGPMKDYKDTGGTLGLIMPDQGELDSGISSGPASTPGDTRQPGTRWWFGDAPGVPVKMADYANHKPILSDDQAARFTWAMLLDGQNGDTVGRGHVIAHPQDGHNIKDDLSAFSALNPLNPLGVLAGDPRIPYSPPRDTARTTAEAARGDGPSNWDADMPAVTAAVRPPVAPNTGREQVAGA